MSAKSEDEGYLDPDQRDDAERDSFDALMRRMARVSESAQARNGAPLSVGAVLAGGRLSVARKLGEGGMGVVYEAFDAQRKGRVALKTLSRLDATAVYRLKNEFRALADVTHENLVRLHELFAEDNAWFFVHHGPPPARAGWVRDGWRQMR